MHWLVTTVYRLLESFAARCPVDQPNEPASEPSYPSVARNLEAPGPWFQIPPLKPSHLAVQSTSYPQCLMEVTEPWRIRRKPGNRPAPCEARGWGVEIFLQRSPSG